MKKMTTEEATAFLRKKRRAANQPTVYGTGELFPLGHYQLNDGREMYGMNDLELKQAVRDADRQLRQSEASLFLKLETARLRAGSQSDQKTTGSSVVPTNLQFDF